MTDHLTDQAPADTGALRHDLAEVLNRHCAENGSNTPDLVLAEFLLAVLAGFDAAVVRRSGWYGRHDAPGLADTVVALTTPATPLAGACLSCGLELDDSELYCQHCGSTREPAPADARPRATMGTLGVCGGDAARTSPPEQGVRLSKVRPWLPTRLRLGTRFQPCQGGCNHCGAGPDEPCYDQQCPCWPYSHDDEAEHNLADEITAILAAAHRDDSPDPEGAVALEAAPASDTAGEAR